MIHHEISKKTKESPRGIGFAEFLMFQLSERIKKNSQYSLRSFARDLEISPGNLSDLLRKRRNFSVKMVKKICTNLALSPVMSQKFITDVVSAPSTIGDEYNTSQISEDQFKIICDWRHFAILRLIGTVGFKADTAWIAKRLGSNVFIINECRDRLLRTGLLSIKGNVWTDFSEGKTSYLKSSETDNYIKTFLRSMLELSAESIDRDPVTDRNHTGMMVSLSKKSLPEAIELIKNFRRSLTALLEENNLKKEEVYYLEIGLFPITKKEMK